ncbi:putative uncharacterized protein [Firmicutes bacterium CAG:822]|nr:putative uncharacterized protein [Firmicutes bacterium CAG:822]
MRTELLSPAGNMETLIAACNNGADAVYVGGKAFGARAFAPNFSNSELKEAVKYCHLYGVKLYVTANTVVFENEIEDFLDYMKFLYEIGVDAVIMQDLGMINLVRRLIPNLEIHASTQINCHNDESLRLLHEMGVTRAVLAREMSIDEIKGLKCPIEKEIFIHGALCVSYSGQCLFSSLNGGRSGNRGSCTGSCRLPYKLYDDKEEIKTDGRYLLSTKELCSVNNIKSILDLKIDSLKIEGRMKSPEYVGYVTKVYRRLIDEYYLGGNPTITEDEMYNLTTLFNREFTQGYLFNDNIYNIKTPNHLGSPLGKVIKVNEHKIFIKLNHDLVQEDGIRFCESSKGMIINKLYNEKGLLVNHVNKGEIAVVDNKIGLSSKDNVNKTISKKLMEMINKVSSKKIPITFKLKALVNQNLELLISDGTNEITEKSIVLDKARNKSTTKEEVYSKLNKLGSTPFYLDKCEIQLDDVFIPMSFLNELRRKVCDELISKRCECNNKVNFKYEKKIIEQNNDSMSILVRNEEQLKCVLGKGRIYTEDYELYKKYKGENVFYKLPRIMNNFLDYKNEKLLVSELGGIYKYSKNNVVIADYPLNITNSETVNFLHSLGVKISTISPEVPDYGMEKYCYPTEKIVYGKPDLMILKTFRKDGKYLKNNIGNYFPIIHGRYTTILNHQNIYLRNYKGRIILLDETEKKIKDLVS